MNRIEAIGWLCVVIITFPVFIGINIIEGVLRGCRQLLWSRIKVK